jgi:hypothetical protein
MSLLLTSNDLKTQESFILRMPFVCRPGLTSVTHCFRIAVNLDVTDFARLIEALHPWLNQIVVIGGWAYRLYRLHPLAQLLLKNPWAVEIDATNGYPTAETRRVQLPNAASFLAQKALIHHKTRPNRPGSVTPSRTCVRKPSLPART